MDLLLRLGAVVGLAGLPEEGPRLLPVLRPSLSCRPEVYIIPYCASLLVLLPYLIHTNPIGHQKHSPKWGDGAPHSNKAGILGGRPLCQFFQTTLLFRSKVVSIPEVSCDAQTTELSWGMAPPNETN